MKKAVIVSFILYFFMGVIHNLGHPVTPELVKDLGIPDVMFGIFFALMSLGLVVAGPFWGILGDKKGKHNLILIGLLVYSLGQYMFGNSGSLFWMVVFRFVSGFGVSAGITLLISYLIEHSDPSVKTRNIAYSAVMLTFGASFGYLIGGRLTGYLPFDGIEAYKMIFTIQALLNVVFAFVIYFAIKPRTEDVVESISYSDKPGLIQGFKDIRKLNKNLIIFLISLSFISTGSMVLTKFIEVYIGNAEDIGDFVFATGLVSMAVTIFLVPLVAKLKKDMTIMIIAQVVSATIVLIVFRSNDLIKVLYTLYMGYVVMKTIYSPLEQSYISGHAVDGNYGSIMGVRQSFFAIGFVIGPIIGGILYEMKPLYAFDFSALMFVIGFVLLLTVKRNLDKEIEDVELVEETTGIE